MGKVLSFLFVDDKTTLLDLYSVLFSNAYKNASIYVAKENKEAFKLAFKYQPDLILSDMIRPGGDGYQFLDMLRSNSRTRHIPVISVTGSVSSGLDKKHIRKAEAEELRQYRAGFNRVIAKPFKLDQLLEIADVFVTSEAETDYALLNVETEAPTFENKESVDLSTRDGCARLAKDIIAMANIGGGTILIGKAERVKGQFEKVGLTKSMLESLEVTTVNKAIRRFMDPGIHVAVRRFTDEGRTFVFLKIPGAKDVPVLAKRNNPAASLYQGRIYIRTEAAESREITEYTELRQLLNRFLGD